MIENDDKAQVAVIDGRPTLPNECITNEKIVIRFEEEGNIIVDVYKFPIFGDNVRSISRIVPVGRNILVAEFGTIDMIKLLNHIKNNQPLTTVAKMMVVGIGNEVPDYIKMGTVFYPRMRDAHIVRPTFDPNNDYSFQKLADKADKETDILAAVSIAGNKDRSKYGLRMDFNSVDPNILENLKNNKSLNNLIYKGKILQFLNYSIMDYTNIDAVIYDF